MNSLNSRLKTELHEIYIREIYVAWRERIDEGETAGTKKELFLKSGVSLAGR